MNILILGEPYFVNNLVNDLSDYDNKNNYILYDNNKSKITKLIIFLKSDVIYFIGGKIENNKFINLSLFLNKKIYMHWIGTDVLQASKAFKNNSYCKDYISKITHFCEVSWIQKELSEITIDADIVQFATFNNKITQSNELPNEFSILTYLGKNREEFYGLNKLIDLAKEFPKIEIKIVGTDLKGNYPSNMKFLGRVHDMENYYKNCVLYLRLVEHDGLAFSVLEALANGRYVGYSYDYNNVFHIYSYERLKEIVKDLLEKFYDNSFKINTDGMDFVKENFGRIVVLERLIERLTC